MSAYRPVPAQVDLPALEHDVLDLWARAARSSPSPSSRPRGRPEWIFYEGPPTANGMPGTHHVEARVFKDVFPRFKTMQGYHVARKAGWDCHGLPVELAVEKELGFTGKNDIEAYGIAEFNAKCRESVLRHVDAFEEMTERMGYWVDLATPTARWTPPTSSRSGGRSSRSSTRACWSRTTGSRRTARAAAPACPTTSWPRATRRSPTRRSTSASRSPPARYAGQAVAAGLDHHAVDAGLQHRGRRAPRRHLRASPPTATRRWSSPSRCSSKVLGEGWTVTGHVHRRGHGALDLPAPVRAGRVAAEPTAAPHFVVLADYVTTEDGTGLVHQSPAFGEDDLAVCRALRPAGGQPGPPRRHFADDVPLVGGAVLQARRRRPGRRTSRSAACCSGTSPTSTATRTAGAATPRCSTTRSRPGTSAPPQVKDALLRENEKTNWYPDTIKYGRYGDWLHNNIDWALSRSRYWGTPLPIWRCARGPPDLRRLAGRALRADRHRPVRPRPAPAVRRRRSPSPAPTVRLPTAADARCPRSSTPGTTRARCRSRSGATRTPRVAELFEQRLPGASSSARRSTRPAAGSTR